MEGLRVGKRREVNGGENGERLIVRIRGSTKGGGKGGRVKAGKRRKG